MGHAKQIIRKRTNGRLPRLAVRVGRAWDDWTVHLDQMDVRDNYLSIPNPNFPDNRLWNPQSSPNMADELTPFLPAPADVVGVGLATCDGTLNRAKPRSGQSTRRRRVFDRS